jgi:valyl-tRNA synthetase
LFERAASESVLAEAAWPRSTDIPTDASADAEIAELQEVIRALRDALARINNSRSATKQSAIAKLPRAYVRAGGQAAGRLNGQVAAILRLGRCEQIEIGEGVAKPVESATYVLKTAQVYVPVGGLMDFGAEKARLSKERADSAAALKRLLDKLGNEEFISKAPAAVVASEQAREAELREKLTEIDRALEELS